MRALRDLQLAESLSRQLSQGSRIAIRSAQLALGLLAAGRVLLACGDRQAAEHAWRELERLSTEGRDLTVDLWTRGARAYLAFADGQLGETVSLAENATTVAREHGLTGA